MLLLGLGVPLSSSTQHNVECWDAGFNKHLPNFSQRIGTDTLEFKVNTSNRLLQLAAVQVQSFLW